MTVKEQELYICDRLREERKNKKLSQLDLSYASGVSQNMITYIETGKRVPSLSTILKLCDALKIEPASIFPTTQAADKESAKRTVLELIKRFM